MEFKVTDHIEEAEQKIIYEGLRAYNQERRVGGAFRELAVFAEDPQGEKCAGLIGETHENWLMVKYLWVREDCRGQGLGSKLLAQAEEEAKNRGCHFVFLDTFDFQAPEFYPKYNYVERFVLENYPLTGKRHYFTKTL